MTADLSNYSEEDVVAHATYLVEVMSELKKLHPTTRVQVLGAAYPNAYQQLAQLYALSKELFEQPHQL